MNPDPYFWIVDSAKLPVLVVLAIFTVIVFLALYWIGQSLQTKVAPLGIISLELAGPQANQILASWSEAARRDGFLSVGLDYLFLCVYPVALSLACDLAANTSQAMWLSRVGTAMSWLVLAAMPLDGVEDYALIRVLKKSGGKVWPGVAKWCAILKFGIVFLGLGYLLLWLILLIAERVM